MEQILEAGTYPLVGDISGMILGGRIFLEFRDLSLFQGPSALPFVDLTSPFPLIFYKKFQHGEMRLKTCRWLDTQ